MPVLAHLLGVLAAQHVLVALACILHVIGGPQRLHPVDGDVARAAHQHHRRGHLLAAVHMHQRQHVAAIKPGVDLGGSIGQRLGSAASVERLRIRVGDEPQVTLGVTLGQLSEGGVVHAVTLPSAPLWGQ